MRGDDYDGLYWRLARQEYIDAGREQELLSEFVVGFRVGGAGGEHTWPSLGNCFVSSVCSLDQPVLLLQLLIRYPARSLPCTFVTLQNSNSLPCTFVTLHVAEQHAPSLLQYPACMALRVIVRACGMRPQAPI